jgi:hypothetical protein
MAGTLAVMMDCKKVVLLALLMSVLMVALMVSWMVAWIVGS